jgi:hypothetical protein
MSLEHHVRTELKLDRVENWEFHAPQTEEESGESPECLSIEISRSKNITIANYHAYRVTRSHAPYPAAVRLYQSGDIHFRNVHVNAESGFATCDQNGCGTFLRASKLPNKNAIQDVTHTGRRANASSPCSTFQRRRQPPPLRRRASTFESSKTGSFQSAVRPWIRQASCTSSITGASESTAGRKPRG